MDPPERTRKRRKHGCTEKKHRRDRLGLGTAGKSASRNAGLTRSMETVSDIPLMSIFIALSEQEKTWYGPSYGVVRGLQMASWRRNTWVHVAQASGTKIRGDDDVRGGTGQSCWANWRSRMTRSPGEARVLPVVGARNAPGRRRPQP